MIDNRLLELAAKAASLEVRHFALSGFNIMSGNDMGKTWNPLTDDGDALRLAIKLNLKIVPDPEMLRTEVEYGEDELGDPKWLAVHWEDLDACAATRLAIVKAAAVIGRGMP